MGGQCQLYTDAATQKNKYAVFSQVAKTITIGKGSRRTKCVHYKDVVCPKNAGDRGIRVNTDYKNAGDRFSFKYSKNKICAYRLEANHGWGMNLQIMCEFKDVSAYQAKFVTTATNHLCENSRTAGGKGWNVKPKKPSGLLGMGNEKQTLWPPFQLQLEGWMVRLCDQRKGHVQN